MAQQILDRKSRSLIMASFAIFTGAVLAALVYFMVAPVYLWISLTRGTRFS